MEKQRSSIDWLENELKERYSLMNSEPLFEQAKAMHKEEIVKAFDEGQECEYQVHINSAPKYDSETYYNETFGGDNEN